MRPEDLTVEVRDKNLQRQGKVLSRDLDLKAKLRWCGVGEWTLNLPGDHPMVPHLRTPGSGLVVTGPTGVASRGVIFSGPTILPKRKRDQKNPDGTLTFQGFTDEIHLDDALAFPSPQTSADPAAQTKSNDIRTGATEDLFRQYVAFNVTYDQALPGRVRGFRNYIDVKGASGGRGLTQTKSPRFQNLLELLQEIAIYDGGYGFRLIQEDDLLLFDTVPVRDLRATVRLDMSNGTLTSEEVASQGATITDAIVAGQGEGVARTIVRRTAPADEGTWSRVIERFFDRRDTNETAQLQQKGDEELAAGAGGLSAKVIPSDDQTMRYLIDWREGDLITVVVDGTEQDSVVTEAVLLVNSTACRVGVSIGDVATFDPRDQETKNQQSIDSRVGYLERSAKLVAVNPNGGVVQTDEGIALEPARVARATKTTDQTVTGGGAAVAVSWQGDTYASGMVSTTNPTRVYPNKAGKWRVTTKVRMVSVTAAGSFAYVNIRKNGSSVYTPSEGLVGPSAAGAYPSATDIVEVTNVGSDYFEVLATSSVTTGFVVSSCVFLLEYIGA